MSRYPAVSHTFFLQEIAGLRALGIEVNTASINPPDRPLELLTDVERAESRQTFYLKGQATVKLLPALLRIVVTHPGVALRGLAAALRLEPGHFTHTLYALFYWAEALLLGDWMRRKQISHLHIHFSGPVASVGMLTSLAWKIPYSLTVHGPDEFFDQNETALPRKVKNAAFIICISEFCKSQLMRISPPDAWEKLRVIRLGVMPKLAELPADATEKMGQGHLQPGNEGTGLRVLCTGRLVGAKGQAILVMATAALLQRRHKLTVTFIGDGADRQVLEQLADATGTRPAIQFAGAKSHAEVLESLRHSDLFVLPSFAEGVPVALMEAMAIGVPCISTFIAGIPELIRHEKDGLLVPAGSVESLTDAMERLLLNADERRRFSESARAYVLEHYNLAINLGKLASALNELAPHAVRPHDVRADE